MKRSFDTDKPHQPKMFKFPKRKFGTQNRLFQSTWFDKFPWLHYDEQSDSVICFTCAKQYAKGNLKTTAKKDLSFLTDGFSNWKKAAEKFTDHQTSYCHKASLDIEANLTQNRNIIEIMSAEATKTMQSSRLCLMKVIESLQYICRQGLAIQGSTDSSSNLFQLLKLRGKDVPSLSTWIDKNSDKYISHESQNEIISIMANQLQRDLVRDIEKSFFSIIADEYTDISNKEQLVVCLRWVDLNLEAHEDFLGFYHIPNIASNTISSAIKDILVRLQLSLSQCRGQCYDGASNMMGIRSGVAQQILECQPKAYPTHCHAHCLSLGVKDTTKNCKILTDTMSNANEVVKLIKYSPKRENWLNDIKANLTDEDSRSVAGVAKFSATRWTVRAACLQSILNNYEAILKLWEECLETPLNPDVRGRIIGCQAQMKSFNFFFGLHLGQKVFSHTDNLSATLQKASLSAADSKHLTSLTVQCLKNIRNDDCFKAFYQNTLQKKQRFHDDIGEPKVPRKRKAPSRFEEGTGAPSFPETPEDLYRRVYFEAIDLLVSAIVERFEQPGFIAYLQLEELLLKALHSTDISANIKYIQDNYAEDINVQQLVPQLDIFKMLINDKQITHFHDILDAVKSLSPGQKHIISEVMAVCKLILVSPATSATGERMFSMARRVKTWLRSNMQQQRFNNIALLHCHKDRTDRIRLLDVANEFVGRNERRKRNFGIFKKEEDL